MDTQYIPVHKDDLKAIDYFVKIGKNRQSVKSESDWLIVSKIFEFWTRRWPQEWQEFADSIKDIRATRLNKKGTSASNEIKYVGAIPYKFMRLLQNVFPFQNFDKKFVYELTRRVNIVKVGEKNDAWFLV